MNLLNLMAFFMAPTKSSHISMHTHFLIIILVLDFFFFSFLLKPVHCSSLAVLTQHLAMLYVLFSG